MRFGGDDQRIAFKRFGELEDTAGAADIIGMVDDVRRGEIIKDWCSRCAVCEVSIKLVFKL